mmetsp:Transcript_115417/g.236024  ORF Transcript_115417/g.236024 Transcript_115417/m.236024 type:complete len:243 (+) Transcript_115417:13-741(+)
MPQRRFVSLLGRRGEGRPCISTEPCYPRPASSRLRPVPPHLFQGLRVLIVVAGLQLRPEVAAHIHEALAEHVAPEPLRWVLDPGITDIDADAPNAVVPRGLCDDDVACGEQELLERIACFELLAQDLEGNIGKVLSPKRIVEVLYLPAQRLALRWAGRPRDLAERRQILHQSRLRQHDSFFRKLAVDCRREFCRLRKGRELEAEGLTALVEIAELPIGIPRTVAVEAEDTLPRHRRRGRGLY